MKLILLLPLIIISCYSEDCSESVEIFRKKSMEIICIEKPNITSRWYEVKGINPTTKKEVLHKALADEYYMVFKYQIQKGDTLIKKRGDLNIYIHKKGNIEVVPFECGGKLMNSK